MGVVLSNIYNAVLREQVLKNQILCFQQNACLYSKQETGHNYRGISKNIIYHCSKLFDHAVILHTMPDQLPQQHLQLRLLYEAALQVLFAPFRAAHSSSASG